MPAARAAAAVAGPTTATDTRAGQGCAPRAWRSDRTPLAEVTSTQSNCSSRPTAERSAAPPSRGWATSISGSGTVTAPSAANSRIKGPAWSRARHTTTRQLPRGPVTSRRPGL
jgi:hypothetical protein